MYKLLIITLVIFVSCDNGPKVIQSENSTESPRQSSGIFDDSKPTSASTSTPMLEGKALHTVKVLEKLPTEKYVYLKVAENSDTYWIATRKQDVEINGVYFYRDGLLKTRFESKEYNKVFDSIYLVANIVPANHGSTNGKSVNIPSSQPSQSTDQKLDNKKQVAGSISIKELLEQQNELEGGMVQVSGTCTKVNPNIMGRNWIHLKDGTADDFDLVVTTNQRVMEGESVTMQGVLTLDKDFGAGYRYNLIIEEGKRIQ